MGKALIVTTAAIVGIAGIVALNYYDVAAVDNNTEENINTPLGAANNATMDDSTSLTVIQTDEPQASDALASEDDGSIENAAPVIADANGSVAISDDGDTLSFATIKLTGEGAQKEKLSVNLSGTDLISAFDQRSGTLTISGVAPLQDYETALRNVAYDGPVENTDRALEVVVNDGEMQSDPAFLAITVQTVGDEDEVHEGDEDEARDDHGHDMHEEGEDHGHDHDDHGHDHEGGEEHEKDVLDTGNEGEGIQ